MWLRVHQGLGGLVNESYEHTIDGLCDFYDDRVDELYALAASLGELGLPELEAYLTRQAEADDQIVVWSQLLRTPAPSSEEDPTRHALWVAAYRLLRRQATVFSDHALYWDGWHPREDPDLFSEVCDE